MLSLRVFFGWLFFYRDVGIFNFNLNKHKMAKKLDLSKIFELVNNLPTVEQKELLEFIENLLGAKVEAAKEELEIITGTK